MKITPAVPRRSLTVLAAAACALAAAQADAASVALQPATARIALDPTLLTLIGLTGATISGTGSGSYGGGTFSAAVNSASVPGTTAGPVTLDWAPDAGIKFANGQASFTISGLSLNSATSTVTGNIFFVSAAQTQTFNDVAFLTLNGVSGNVGGAPLTAVVPSSTPAGVSLTANADLSLTGLANVISVLGITNVPPGTSLKAGTLTITSVPEPSSMLSLGAGLGVLAAFGARRRKGR